MLCESLCLSITALAFSKWFLCACLLIIAATFITARDRKTAALNNFISLWHILCSAGECIRSGTELPRSISNLKVERAQDPLSFR